MLWRFQLHENKGIRIYLAVFRPFCQTAPPYIWAPHSLGLHFNCHFLGGPRLARTIMSSLWILLEPSVMEVVSGNNWSYKRFKAPISMSPPNKPTSSFYRPDALPVAQTTLAKHWREAPGILRSIFFWFWTFRSHHCRSPLCSLRPSNDVKAEQQIH